MSDPALRRDLEAMEPLIRDVEMSLGWANAAAMAVVVAVGELGAR